MGPCFHGTARPQDADRGYALELILQPFRHFTYVTTHSPILPSLHLRHSSFSNPSVALPTSQLILQPFRCFNYVAARSPTLLSLLIRHSSAHSPSFPSLHLRQNSFSNPSVALPTSQLILQPFRCFTYVAAHSTTLLSLLIRHSSAHSPTFPSLHLRHNSFSNPSVALPTSKLILQPFRCFTYVAVHSPTLISLLLRHKLFT